MLVRFVQSRSVHPKTRVQGPPTVRTISGSWFPSSIAPFIHRLDHFFLTEFVLPSMAIGPFIDFTRPALPDLSFSKFCCWDLSPLYACFFSLVDEPPSLSFPPPPSRSDFPLRCLNLSLFLPPSHPHDETPTPFSFFYMHTLCFAGRSFSCSLHPHSRACSDWMKQVRKRAYWK